MKKMPVLVLLLAAGTISRAQDNYSKEPFLVKQLAAELVQNAKLETTGGNISVSGTDANARLEVFVWPGNSRERNLSKAELQKRLDEDYDLTISVTDHKLTAIAKPKQKHRDWDNNNNLSISFRLFVPHNVSTDLRTSGGNISISDLSGANQDFTTSGGNLEVHNISGHITGRTSGGNINVTDSKEEINLTTSGGNIEAKTCHGNIRLSTSGGELSLRNLQGTIHANTSGGNIDAENVDGELTSSTSGGNVTMTGLTCSLETSTSGGNIDVTMKALGKYVKITNSSGNIDLELPDGKGLNLKLYGERVKASKLNNFSGKMDEQHIDGTLNGGGIPITVDGGSGTVHLALK